MTVDYELDAAVEFKKYLWHKIVEDQILDAEEYWSDNLGVYLVPIIPIQQSAEMNQFLSGKTHFVYDKIGLSYEENWVICCEQILFNIYSTKVSEINKIRNYMTDLFRRMDESAKDMNAWQGKSNMFKFHSVFIADISPTSPSEELQGFLSTEVVLEVKYSRHIDYNGRFR